MSVRWLRTALPLSYDRMVQVRGPSSNRNHSAQGSCGGRAQVKMAVSARLERATLAFGRRCKGFVYVVDRKKDMIISGGENVYSWEVEEVLRSHPDVIEVAVIAVPDVQWGEAVKACVQLRAGATASEAQLIEYTRERIASYKKPRSMDFVDTLPRLFNGKIDKKALRAPYWAGRDRQVS